MAKEEDVIEEVVTQASLADTEPQGGGGNPFSGNAKAITQVLQGIAKGMFSPEGVANTISVGGYGIGKALKAKADAGDFDTNRGPTEYQINEEARRNPNAKSQFGPGSLLNQPLSDDFEKQLKDFFDKDPREKKVMGGMMYNKGSLVGNQSLLDKNNDGDITGEDFKMLREKKIFGGLLKLSSAGAKAAGKSLLADATKDIKKISKDLPSASQQKSIKDQFSITKEQKDQGFENASREEILAAQIENRYHIQTLEGFFSGEPKLEKAIKQLRKQIYSKVKDKDVADDIYATKLLELESKYAKQYKKLTNDTATEFLERQEQMSDFEFNDPTVYEEFGKEPRAMGGRIDYQEGSLMMPPEMESDMPVDTYPNIPPEEMAEAEASQLPDAEMEDKYMDFVLDQSLDDDEQSYLMNALETDPKLSQIFDKVITTASEFTGAGEVEGPGTGVSDSIPARLSDGEFVFTKKATDQMGADNLQMMMDDAERAFDGGEMRSPKQEGGMMYKQKDEDPLAYEKIAQDEIKKNMLRANRAPSLLGGN